MKDKTPVTPDKIADFLDDLPGCCDPRIDKSGPVWNVGFEVQWNEECIVGFFSEHRIVDLQSLIAAHSPGRSIVGRRGKAETPW